MSVAISYDDLSDAAKSAKKVANYFDDYADELQSRVLNKMATYDGTWTSNMSSAYGDVSTKINAMKTMSTAFETYQKSLEGLRDTCESTDEAVKSKVASLTSEFKENNGIRDSKVENFVAYVLTSVGNSTCVGRYLGNGQDAVEMGADYIKEQISVWYNFEGGKDVIKGCLVALLEAAVAVLGVVVTIVGGVTGVLEVIALVGAIVLAVVAVANAGMNFYNEIRAYNANQDGDPALAMRLSNQNSWQTYLREGDICDEENEGWLNNHVGIANDIAMGIDIVEFCATAVVIVANGAQIIQKVSTWCTSQGATSFTSGVSKIFGGVKNGFGDIKSAIKLHDLSKIDKMFQFSSNLKKSFTGLKGIKNVCTISKDLLKDGFNLGTIAETGFKNVIISNMQLFEVQLPKHDKPSSLKLSDFYSIGDKIGKLKDSPVLGASSFEIPEFDANIINKLSSSTNISVAFG